MAADTAAAAMLLIFDLCLKGEVTGRGAGPSLGALPKGFSSSTLLAQTL